MKTHHVLLVSITSFLLACDAAPAEVANTAAPTNDSAATNGAETSAKAPTNDALARPKVQEDPPAPEAADPNVNAEKPLSGLSDKEFDAILASVGCPDGSRSSEGCDVCPRGLHSDVRPYENPFAPGIAWKTPSILSFSGSSTRKTHAFSGTFALGGADHLLVYGGCPLIGDASRERPSQLYLTSRGALVGVLEGYKDDTRLEECAMPRDAAGKAHVLCVQSRGRSGVESLEILRAHAPTGGNEDDLLQYEGLEGFPSILETEGTWEKGPREEELVFPASHRLVFDEVRDVDGDGDEDVLATSGADTRWTLTQGEGGVFVGEQVE